MSGKTQFAESGGPVDKVRAHIEAHHDRPIPLAELGRLVHMSPFTVQRLFKQALGVSPLQYQRALRAASLRKEFPLATVRRDPVSDGAGFTGYRKHLGIYA